MFWFLAEGAIVVRLKMGGVDEAGSRSRASCSEGSRRACSAFKVVEAALLSILCPYRKV